MSISSKKIEQITHFYLFHKQIELIFNFGINFLYKKQSSFFWLSAKKEPNDNFYIIDINWINSWKNYSGYNKFLNYLEKRENKFNSEKELKKEIEEICNNMVLTGEITDSEYCKPPSWNNESYGNLFIHKIFYNLEDFDCLVDEETFNFLKELANDLIYLNQKQLF